MTTDMWKYLKDKAKNLGFSTVEGAVFDGGGTVDITIHEQNGQMIYDGQGIRLMPNGLLITTH